MPFFHPFERQLSVAAEELADLLERSPSLGWLDFWLNPRRLRGSDFLMRWSQGVWSEKRLVEAVNATGEFFAMAYGPSGTAPTGDVRAFELYFERLEAAGLGQIKRPDLLVFSASNREDVMDAVASLGGEGELPFIPETRPQVREILGKALIAVECENSLWRASRMPDFGAELRPQRRMGGRLGLKKSAVLPTVIIKDEDRQPLRYWQESSGVPLHIWHVFFDRAYGLAFDRAEELVTAGETAPTVQVFQAPGGATSRKIIFKHYYHHAYELGLSAEEPVLKPACIEDKNGHVLPFVTFDGGMLELSGAAKTILREASARGI